MHDEVKVALLLHMHPMKGFGPNGFHPNFIQIYWYIVGV